MPATALTLEEAAATAATGDVWLFRGRSLADVAIRTVTNSPVNHVGMVVALDDLPPLLWHAELGRSLPDVWTGQMQRGVQLHRLVDAVRTWDVRYGQRAWFRQLEGTIERRHEDRLMEVIERFDGRAFPSTPGLARQWLTGRWRRRESSLETIYCAELVATTYQHMGLLPKRRPASFYDPGRFWSGDRIDLVPPFALGGEIPVTAGDSRTSWRPDPCRLRVVEGLVTLACHTTKTGGSSSSSASRTRRRSCGRPASAQASRRLRPARKRTAENTRSSRPRSSRSRRIHARKRPAPSHQAP